MSVLPLRKPQKISRTDKAYLKIKEEIMENRMPPGYQALEAELAENLQMSRTPVREALIRLQNEGMVEVIPRRGMRVLSLSPHDMQEIYEVLTCIESEAAALLARGKPTKKELKPLVDAMDAMEKAMAEDDLDAWSEADNRYHRRLLELCGNKRLADIAAMYMDQAHRARMFTLRLREKPSRSTEEHREHVRLILAGEVEQARESYRHHRERARIELMEIIKKYRISNL